jgi:hypothetical protein
VTAAPTEPSVGSVGSVGSAGAVGDVGPAVGNDISWPQCGRAYPTPAAFAIVGVNDGHPYSANPCLVSEYRWAASSGVVAYYMNTDNPGVAPTDAYNYGFGAARDAFAYATARVSAGRGHLWWLDVETGNSWSPDQGANTAVIAGSIAFFRTKGVTVGIYSTRYQWGVITGGARIPSVPNWVPGAQSAADAPSFCLASRSFSGGPVVMAQFTTQFDNDYLCPGASLSGTSAAVPSPGLDLANLLNSLLAWLSSL